MIRALLDALRPTPQSAPLPGQVPNSAGGFAWAVDDWSRLDRFLILGTEGGSYHATEKELTLDAAQAVLRCLAADGPRVVARIREVSVTGRAPKNDQAVFALALALKRGDVETRRAAAAALPAVCRTGTHLFQLVGAVEAIGGWGRVTKRAVGSWYTDKAPRELAYQLVKYRQREGFSHRDVLRLAKPAGFGPDTAHGALFRWATRDERPEGGLSTVDPGLALADAAVAARTASLTETLGLLTEHRLPWEAVASQHLTSPLVWEALLDAGLPLTALIRNLARMSACGLLVAGSAAERQVIARLGDVQGLHKARVHPLFVLSALTTYGRGQGVRGSLTWTPAPGVQAALDAAFYAAFQNVRTTGLRWRLAIDVSGSMGCGELGGFPGISPRVGAAAMAMITAARERDASAVGFTAAPRGYGGQWGGGTPGLTPISLQHRRLDALVSAIAALPMGGTDCALPIVQATKERARYDVFVVYTDNETWAGAIHPADALARYRDTTGIAARLIVVGMVSNGFTIARPGDPGMLDVVGFDSAAPDVMAAFAEGNGEA